MNNLEQRALLLKALEMLSGAFPNWKANKLTFEAYLMELEDLDPARVALAIRHIRRTRLSDFVPSIATIRELVDPLKSGDEREGGIWRTAKVLDLLDANNKLKALAGAGPEPGATAIETGGQS